MPPRENAHIHAKLQVHCSFFNQLLHCNVCKYGLHSIVLLEMMMSVLQEVKRLTKCTSLYFPG